MVVHTTLLLLLASGIYNAMAYWGAYKLSPRFTHPLFGMHLLFGLTAFAILLVVLGRRGSVCRVVVCKSGARTHSVSPTLDLHNRRAEPELCSRSHKVRSRHWGTTLGPMRRLLKARTWPLREREFSSLDSPCAVRPEA